MPERRTGPGRRGGGRAAGFTLLELLVSLTLLMLMSGLVAAGFSPWLAFQQDLETGQRLAAQQALWLAWLERHASELESAGGEGGLPIGSDWLPDGTRLAGSDWPARLAVALGSAGPPLVEDGFHQPWLVRVSHALAREADGVALHYHVIALLSPGANGHFEPGTRFDPASGALTLAGDDRGIVIDGWPLARRQFDQLQLKLERAAALWQDWFRARWEGDAERDPSIDYFTAACPGDVLASAWDPAPDALPSTCAAQGDAFAPGARLGLGPSELRDPTGASLRFDASSVRTRNPGHPDPGQRSPPYSAIVSGALPGGVTLSRAVLGTL